MFNSETHSCQKIYFPIHSSTFTHLQNFFSFKLDFLIVKAFEKVTKDKIHLIHSFLQYLILTQLEGLKVFKIPSMHGDTPTILC